MKRVTFQEVITKIKAGEKYKSELFTITLDAMNELTIEHKDGFDDNDSGIYFNMSEKIFSKVEEPVSFIEAIKSCKRIKCVHVRFSSSNQFMTITEMFNRMSMGAEDFPIDLIENGKWYLEE